MAKKKGPIIRLEEYLNMSKRKKMEMYLRDMYEHLDNKSMLTEFEETWMESVDILLDITK